MSPRAVSQPWNGGVDDLHKMRNLCNSTLTRRCAMGEDTPVRQVGRLIQLCRVNHFLIYPGLGRAWTQVYAVSTRDQEGRLQTTGCGTIRQVGCQLSELPGILENSFTPHPLCTIQKFKSLSQRPTRCVQTSDIAEDNMIYAIYQRIHNITQETYSEFNCPLIQDFDIEFRSRVPEHVIYFWYATWRHEPLRLLDYFCHKLTSLSWIIGSNTPLFDILQQMAQYSYRKNGKESSYAIAHLTFLNSIIGNKFLPYYW